MAPRTLHLPLVLAFSRSEAGKNRRALGAIGARAATQGVGPAFAALRRSIRFGAHCRPETPRGRLGVKGRGAKDLPPEEGARRYGRAKLSAG